MKPAGFEKICFFAYAKQRRRSAAGLQRDQLRGYSMISCAVTVQLIKVPLFSLHNSTTPLFSKSEISSI